MFKAWQDVEKKQGGFMLKYKIQKSDIFGNFADNAEAADKEANLYETVNNLYHMLFSFYPSKKPSFDISDKDYKVITTFTNEKSFEKAIDVCFQLLKTCTTTVLPDLQTQDVEDEESGRVSVCEDTKILVGLVNLLADCRVPHHMKPGFLIIMVRHCFYEM